MQTGGVQQEVEDGVGARQHPQGVGAQSQHRVPEAEGGGSDGLRSRDGGVLAEQDVRQVGGAEDGRGQRGGSPRAQRERCAQHHAAEPELLVDAGRGVPEGEDEQRRGVRSPAPGERYQRDEDGRREPLDVPPRARTPGCDGRPAGPTYDDQAHGQQHEHHGQAAKDRVGLRGDEPDKEGTGGGDEEAQAGEGEDRPDRTSRRSLEGYGWGGDDRGALHGVLQLRSMTVFRLSPARGSRWRGACGRPARRCEPAPCPGPSRRTPRSTRRRR